MARAKKEASLTPEERLQAALVPDWEWPHKLPENWCWTTVGAINQYVGISADPTKAKNETFELYSVPSSAGNYPEIVLGADIGSTKQAVKKGDVLLCKINPRINRVWKVSKYTDHSLLASSEWIVVRNSRLISNYLMWCFRSPYFRGYMLSNVSGVGGSLMRAQPKFVQGYPVPVPPLAEQQRIVDRIESLFAKLDEAKEKAQAVVDSFETRKAAILHKAFTGELTAKWREEHGVGMESWEYKTFEAIVENMQNGLAKRKGISGTPYVVLRLANLTDCGFNTDDLREILLDEKEQANYELRPNDVIMIRVNGSKDNVGKQYLITNQHHWAFCDHIIRIQYSNRLLPQYMIYFSRSKNYRIYVKENIVSSAGQNTISRKGMVGLIVPTPCLNEQFEIVHILDDLFSKEQQSKETAEIVLNQIDLMKKSILTCAFRGELGTNDPSEESAVELLKRTIL